MKIMLLLSHWSLTWDARADSGSTLVFASKEFLFDGSNWVLQSKDLKEKLDINYKVRNACQYSVFHLIYVKTKIVHSMLPTKQQTFTLTQRKYN